MNLGPTTRTSAVDACEAALRTAILEQRFVAGDRLPPERTLAETLGVNRTTLRSALSRLREAGLVSPRQGDGCIVLDFRRDGGPELVGALLGRVGDDAGATDIARDLFALRRAIAATVLERLGANPPSVKRQKSVQLAAQAFALAAGRGAPASELAALDVAMLSTIVDLAGSDVFRLFLNPVTRILGGFTRLTEQLYGDASRHVAAHEAVLAWLAGPSEAGARILLQAMAEHDARVLHALRRGSGHQAQKPRRDANSRTP